MPPQGCGAAQIFGAICANSERQRPVQLPRPLAQRDGRSRRLVRMLAGPGATCAT
jgi:hypothetical protein